MMFVFYFNSATDDAQKMMQMSGGGGFGFNASQVSKNLNYCELCVLFYEAMAVMTTLIYLLVHSFISNWRKTENLEFDPWYLHDIVWLENDSN